MSLSTNLTGVMIVLFVSLLIAYIILSVSRPNAITSLSPIVGSIGTPTNVGTTNDVRDLFLTPPGSTFLTYIFCTVNNKTPSVGGSQDAISIFGMGHSVKLQIIPGGMSSPPKTVLSVKTQGPGESVEQISIPDFPQQRWVHLGIVREGRRYTIYYNGKPVASHRTTYFPVVNSSQLTMGDKRLRGEFVGVKVVPTPLRLEEIQSELRDTSDTRHQPYKPTDIASVIGNFGCPNGLFCFSTSSPPKGNPLKMWESPYA
jgi:hypothetical protein